MAQLPSIARSRADAIERQRGNIAIFAGCKRQVFERILPVLTVMGRRVLHTGGLGSASVLKVVTNYLATANLVSLSEAVGYSGEGGHGPGDDL